jgi:hypothetical protein
MIMWSEVICIRWCWKCIFQLNEESGCLNVRAQLQLFLANIDEFALHCHFRYGDLVFSFLLVINILHNSFVNVGLFTGFSLDDDSTFRVYHLQFSNDTLFIGNDSWGSNRAIKANLLLFEMILSLKVNFHKSLLMRVIFAALSVSRTPYFYSSAT